MRGDHADSAMLDELAAHGHVGEILDVLSESGCNTALLTRMVRAPQADLASALRLIATHGLLASGDPDSWDEPITSSGVIRLSDRGEAVAQALSNRQPSRATQVSRRPWPSFAVYRAMPRSASTSAR